jgi:hypothetical protein
VTGRGLRGRRTARLLLFAAVAIDALVVLLFLAAPNTIGPLQSGPPSPLLWLVPAIGIALNVVGLGLMIRIYRADPEAHRSWLRSNRW